MSERTEREPRRFVGRLITRARKAADVKQEALAIAAGVTVDTIRRWERGEQEPDATPLAAIAALTGKPLDFFFERAS